VCENGVLFMAMCDDAKPRVPFAFLEDVKAKFTQMYTGDQIGKAIAYSLDKEFGKVLCSQMEHWNSPGADNFGNVNSKIDEVKNVMVQNIDSILARGEKLDMLVDRTQELQESSKQFRNQSKALRQAMLWRKIKMYGLMVLALTVFLWLLTSFICGFDYKKCK
jgi:vesicle-associated membrane protein 7